MLSSRAVGAALAMMIAVPGMAKADLIKITYGAAGAQTASSVVVANATTIGTETFDSIATGGSGFSTTYGTSSIVGTYSSGANIVGADQYGGANGTGRYVDAYGGSSGYSIKFTTTGLPGVNYFGYWLSALDGGNQLVFKRGGTTVGSYTPSDLAAALGACSSSNPYCGNPTSNFSGQDGGQAYAFVNFVDLNGLFDEIDVYESPNSGNYESDNHTVAYCANASACVSGTSVPEPVSIALLCTALAGLMLFRLRSRV